MLGTELFYFTLPLLLSGVLHHFLVVPRDWLAFAARPIDGNRQLGTQPILGPAKTWRGVIIMMVGTALGTAAVSLFVHLPLRWPASLAGALIGLGYALGELPNSFLKRRLGIATSQRGRGVVGAIFIAIDQVDSIIGALVALTVVYRPSWALVTWLFIIGTMLHLALDRVLWKWSYKRRLRVQPSTEQPETPSGNNRNNGIVGPG